MTSIVKANNTTHELPSMVGPDLYQLFTDAKLFITKVYVNDVERKLSNAEGGGSIRNENYRFSGATGYANTILLNGFLRSGNNKIKVVFEPSDILDKAREEGLDEVVIRDMYAHMVVVRGQLTEQSSGVRSYELDQLIASSGPDVDVLTDKLLRRFTKEKLEDEVSIVFELEVPASAKVIQTTMQQCEFKLNKSSNFSGTLMLNNTLIESIEDNRSREEAGMRTLIRSGENTFELNITSINKEAEENYLDVILSCSLRDIISGDEFSFRRSMDFGDFFSDVHIPLVRFTFSEEGSYRRVFEFKL